MFGISRCGHFRFVKCMWIQGTTGATCKATMEGKGKGRRPLKESTEPISGGDEISEKGGWIEAEAMSSFVHRLGGHAEISPTLSCRRGKKGDRDRKCCKFRILGDSEISWSLLAALKFQDSRVPGFQDSRIAGFQYLRPPRIPVLQGSRVPGFLRFQDSRKNYVWDFALGSFSTCGVYVDPGSHRGHLQVDDNGRKRRTFWERRRNFGADLWRRRNFGKRRMD